jgi:hypothetical protein
MKTCSTCKWVLEPGMFAKCGKNKLPVGVINPLTGFIPYPKPSHYVEEVRGDPGACGVEGAWWESKNE